MVQAEEPSKCHQSGNYVHNRRGFMSGIIAVFAVITVCYAIGGLPIPDGSSLLYGGDANVKVVEMKHGKIGMEYAKSAASQMGGRGHEDYSPYSQGYKFARRQGRIMRAASTVYAPWNARSSLGKPQDESLRPQEGGKRTVVSPPASDLGLLQATLDSVRQDQRDGMHKDAKLSKELKEPAKPHAAAAKSSSLATGSSQQSRKEETRGSTASKARTQSLAETSPSLNALPPAQQPVADANDAANSIRSAIPPVPSSDDGCAGGVLCAIPTDDVAVQALEARLQADEIAIHTLTQDVQELRHQTLELEKRAKKA
ncbi:hypothetical protein GUITHDRAFT_141393 [Guillardia theta CCMP2712]|uniref:Transmembrane protein n=1 Tax=Guillardia theta (strain CCMP2712) TaxID=905079 RepID=L1J270_GUITC|nr:hypothetical protein GUITHDRAFT_141393 [Guillardia theta CCMP2712]EKX42190.1 hypothetical protein GUITHDRAFT_141393 [Guillardia theta CCMP2712]|mmetsp:Transcript_31480/g.100759  ORF Transcript_31480/g.100759 Transcript_31480/m.100759 type:complete len:313 (-) Transcript_31480:221-1159(-)|eukprot:XP_005829170.1 hypothetical protein GUITHDRAFT_141393 [Guillardia theta CCMP2712]